MKNPKITIGVLLYQNAEEEVIRCLNGIREQTALGTILEVIFRDQGGGHTLPFVERWLEKNAVPFSVKLESGDNIGFGAGHNLLFGNRNTASMAYLCLNPDGLMHRRCLQAMIELADVHHWRGLFEAIQEPIMHPKYFDTASGSTAWCSGACVLMPVEVYSAVNGFDDDFFLYCEDVDISWRVKAAGYGCFTAVNALFFHYSEERSSRAVDMWRSALLLSHKWRGDKFKSQALKNFLSFVDVTEKDILDNIERSEQHSMEEVLRAKPDFSNGLVFARQMWSQ
ncbi:glycosyltransferase family 2 protein [Achromobacter denitrificans]|uniref:Glycosyltransferase family 2 protein n=1 Tax=Achromobacter denitrificans TaxID=32002 RepID=A0ABZ3G0I6_ACHDE|nr:glycosyltransferase family 2 protein [Achromobacter denitrificans]